MITEDEDDYNLGGNGPEGIMNRRRKLKKTIESQQPSQPSPGYNPKSIY